MQPQPFVGIDADAGEPEPVEHLFGQRLEHLHKRQTMPIRPFAHRLEQVFRPRQALAHGLDGALEFGHSGAVRRPARAVQLRTQRRLLILQQGEGLLDPSGLPVQVSAAEREHEERQSRHFQKGARGEQMPFPAHHGLIEIDLLDHGRPLSLLRLAASHGERPERCCKHRARERNRKPE